jgi:hypothetical protein
MRAVSIAELGRVLNPASGRKVIAVLQASLDASWDQPIGITAVAGYVAPLDEWANVEGTWKAGLAEWKIPYFHLRELKGWLGEHRAALCELYFANIISQARLCAVGAALLDSDWDQLDWQHMTTVRLESRYKQALDMSLDVLGDYGDEFFSDEPISVLFDADGKEEYIEAAFKSKQPKYGNFQYFAVSSIKIPSSWPLQCADLGAGLLRRSWKAIFDDPERNDQPWGEMPKGVDTKSKIGVWSLQQGAVIWKALQRMQAQGIRGAPDAKPDPNSNEEPCSCVEATRVRFRGDYVLGTVYRGSEHVHYAGCAWIARRQAASVPGSDDWILAGPLSRGR